MGQIHGSRHGILVSTIGGQSNWEHTHSQMPASEHQKRLAGMGLKRKIVSDSLCSIHDEAKELVKPHHCGGARVLCIMHQEQTPYRKL